MKRILYFVIFCIIAFGGGIYFIPDSIAPYIPASLHSRLELISPTTFKTISMTAKRPKPIRLFRPVPLNRDDSEESKQMVSTSRFGRIAAFRAGTKLNRLQHLGAGNDFIATLDVLEKDVLVLSPTLDFKQKFKLKINASEIIERPIAMTARGDEIYVMGDGGKLAWWNSKGKLLGNISITKNAYDLAILANGDFLVHGTRERPFRLFQYTRTGIKKKRFGAVAVDDSLAAIYLQKGVIASDSLHPPCFVSRNPYAIDFFEVDGNYKKSLHITPDFAVDAPLVEKHNNKIQILSQRIVYDAVWGVKNLHILVAPQKNIAASFMDVFSNSGTFLERYALPLNAMNIVIFENDIILLAWHPKYGIERYRIRKMQINRLDEQE